MKKNTRIEFERLLQARNEYPEKQTEIDQEIHSIFSQTHALVIVDMSGFSRTTIRYGIIHFLAMIHRMQLLAIPALESGGGKVIKQDADNLFAIFPSVSLAVNTAIDLLKATAAVNTMLPEEKDIYLSIGIGYGEVLMIDNEEMYGSEFNLASKLGEDLAQRGEILLTEAAFQQLEEKVAEYKKVEFSISGLELVAYKVQ
jgi:adenylate cyclase